MNVKVDAMKYDRKDIKDMVDVYFCTLTKNVSEPNNFDKLHRLYHPFDYDVFGLNMFDKFIYIGYIVVKEDYRHKGIGSKVLDDIKKKAKESGLPIFLLVRCTSTEELNRYEDGEYDVLKNKEKFFFKNGFSNVNIGALKQSYHIAMCWCPPTCSVSVNNIVDKLMGWTM